jgi:hypothetical protein
MIHFKKFLTIIILIFLTLETVIPQDLLDYSNSLKYADYLFRTRQYDLSAREFERVVFLEPKDTIAKLKLVRSYRYLKEYETALEKIQKFFPNRLNYLSKDFSKEYIKIKLYENQFQNVLNFLHQNSTLDTLSKAEYELGVLVLQQKWSEAKIYSDYHPDFLKKSESFYLLNRISTNGLKTKYRNPVLAASLSAVLPGSGKCYSNRWKDAVFSFLFMASASWLTYKSYDNNGFKFNTILFGSVTFGFYAANIYGSSKSASQYNQKINESFRHEAEEILINDHER